MIIVLNGIEKGNSIERLPATGAQGGWSSLPIIRVAVGERIGMKKTRFRMGRPREE